MTISLAELTRRAAGSDPQLAALTATTALSPKGRNLITVASGKGGVGKTWFSVTLAHALAKRSRRVLLFDGDLGLANVDIQLGLLPERDIGAVIGGRSELKDVIVRFNEETQAKTGFDIIAGRSGSGALGRLKPGALAGLRDSLVELGGGYDHLILDLAAGIDPGVTTLADHGGMTLVIVTPDPTSLTDAYAFVKLHRQRHPDADIRIVVNQAGSRIEGQRTYDGLKRACETFLKFTPPFLGLIRRDRNVTAAIRSQTPILTRYPTSEAAEAVAALAAKLAP